MPRYIDATKLQKKIKFDMNNSKMTDDFYKGAMWVLNKIRQCRREKNIQEVKHGKWETYDEHIKGHLFWCSVCEKGERFETKYCPHCGAKMDKKEKRNELHSS